jgi:hypothetical protein
MQHVSGVPGKAGTIHLSIDPQRMEERLDPRVQRFSGLFAEGVRGLE